jgi:hypothetical protein
MTNTAKEWVVVGTFESVMAAARRIRELEGNQAHGHFFEIFVECDFGADDEHFSVLHHTGNVRITTSGGAGRINGHHWLTAGVLKFALDDRNPARRAAQEEAAMTVRGREEPLQSLREAERHSAL